LEGIGFASVWMAAAGFSLAAFRALAIALHCVYVKASAKIGISVPRLHGAKHIDPIHRPPP
jgi:hypothetical protein